MAADLSGADTHSANTSVTVKRLLGAFLLSALLAAVAIIATSLKGTGDKGAYGDGLIYRYVAEHLTTPPTHVDPVVSSRGTSLRYGRIGFPALIWAAAAGHNTAMPYAQSVLIVIAAGAVGAATTLQFPAAGPLAAMIPFIAPGFALSVVGGYGEVVGVAFALWAVVLAVRERWWAAAGLLAAAMLTRENAGAVLVGLVTWQLIHKRFKSAGILATSIIPLVGWYAFCAARFGSIPLLDPYLRVRTDTIGAPIVSVMRSLTHGPGVSIATAAIHLAIALVAFMLWRRNVLAIVAAAAGLQVLSSGVFAWHFVGDAMRAFTFLELFVVMTMLNYRWPTAEYISR